MTPIATIVEGDGEVAALPIVLRRLAEWLSPELGAVEVPTPIRVRRDRFLNRDEEFRRMLLLAAAKCGEAGWILVLLDADDDCPAELAPKILDRAQDVVPHRRVSVVLANREFEAWFLAGAESLDGKRGFSYAQQETFDPEAVRNAKGWLSERMGAGRYRETTDQPAFATLLDLRLAHDRSRSFRKLCGEWAKRVA